MLFVTEGAGYNRAVGPKSFENKEGNLSEGRVSLSLASLMSRSSEGRAAVELTLFRVAAVERVRLVNSAEGLRSGFLVGRTVGGLG